MAGHRYLSTACLHQEHTRCRVTCKYCPAACVCACHRNKRAPLPATQTDGAAQATPVQAE